MLRRSVPLTLLALALVFGGLYGVRHHRDAEAARAAASTGPAPVTVAASRATAGPLPVSLEAVGSLEAVREVTIAPEVPGRVVAIFFEAGARVREGDRLVQLFDAPERADLANFQAQAALARIELGRSRQLNQRQFAAQATVDQNRARLDQATAGIARMEAEIARKLVRAPFAGELGIRRVNLGQYLNAGEPIATLTDLDRLYVNFTLPQQELGRIAVGQEVEVSADAYPGRPFRGRVTAIEPRIGKETRNVALQGLIENPDHALRPGMYVEARLVLPPEPKVVTVPETAIQGNAAGDTAYVVRGAGPDGKGGKAELVAVRVGRRVDGRIAVLEGIAAGDLVVVSGQVKLSPGAPVTLAPTNTLARNEAGSGRTAPGP